jgi:hypothetical protein
VRGRRRRPGEPDLSVRQLDALEDPVVESWLARWRAKELPWGQAMVGACLALSQRARLSDQALAAGNAAAAALLRRTDRLEGAARAALGSLPRESPASKVLRVGLTGVPEEEV